MKATRMKELAALGEPGPKRDLATLVRKLDLLTGDVGITLTAQQAAAVNDCLKDVEKIAKMSNDDARAKYDRLAAVLNENQKGRLEAIGLPLTAPSDGPGSTGPMPGMGHEDAAAKQDQNPFQKDAEGKAVKSLRERFAPKGTAPKAETPKTPPAKAEAAKSSPPKAAAAKH